MDGDLVTVLFYTFDEGPQYGSSFTERACGQQLLELNQMSDDVLSTDQLGGAGG